ncbi:hypothetical protein D3C86_1205280 [compost metagenome]
MMHGNRLFRHIRCLVWIGWSTRRGRRIGERRNLLPAHRLQGPAGEKLHQHDHDAGQQKGRQRNDDGNGAGLREIGFARLHRRRDDTRIGRRGIHRAGARRRFPVTGKIGFQKLPLRRSFPLQIVEADLLFTRTHAFRFQHVQLLDQLPFPQTRNIGLVFETCQHLAGFLLNLPLYAVELVAQRPDARMAFQH